MIIKEYNFDFKDLTIDLLGLKSILGYPDGVLPSPFDTYLTEALVLSHDLKDICAAYIVLDSILIEPSKGILQADGQLFNLGKTVCKELRNAEQLIFFVCTAGRTLSDKSTQLLFEDDPVKGYIYDQLGIFLTEAVGDKMEQIIRETLLPGQKITNRYSPGYCHWEVSDQFKLFSLFPDAPGGVTLTPSALMDPVKSISGVIGVGESVTYREYPCALCLSQNCAYRKIA